MREKKLNLFDRIEGLNEGLGIEAKIWRDPLVLEFRPRKDPFSKFFIDAPLPNQVVFEVITKNEVAVSYLEIFSLDEAGEIPSVRVKCEFIKISRFRQIMNVYKIIPKGELKY